MIEAGIFFITMILPALLFGEENGIIPKIKRWKDEKDKL